MTMMVGRMSPLVELLLADIALLHNEVGQRLVDRTELIEGDHSSKEIGSAPIFGDYDNDGDLDLFVPVRAGGRDLLFQNQHGMFFDVAVSANLQEETSTDNAIWIDFDKDGDLDLFAVPRLLANQSDGSFLNVTQSVGLDSLIPPLSRKDGGVASADFDDDGWPDLYLGLNYHSNLVLLSNQGLSFIDGTTQETADFGTANGVAVGDVDSNGLQDIFHAVGLELGAEGPVSEDDATRFRPKMILNYGAGSFLDVTEGVNLAILTGLDTRSPHLADFDNDGYVDLLVSQILPISGWFEYEVRLFLNDGQGGFTEASFARDYQAKGENGVVGDFDRDGFLDLLWTEGLPLFSAAPVEFLRNTVAENSWLEVELAGQESNRNGLGARVLVATGSMTKTTEILGGFGNRQSEMVARFGLGSYVGLVQVDVTWPSGSSETFFDVPINRRVRIVEDSGRQHTVDSMQWVMELPDTLARGVRHDLLVSVETVLFDEASRIMRVAANLAELGGPREVEMQHAGGGVYVLDYDLSVEGATPASVDVTVHQETELGLFWSQLSKVVHLSEAPTAVAMSSPRPTRFFLTQNYPNPFNGSTKLDFSIPATKSVTVKAYNLLGQPVRTLIVAELQEGEHSVLWDSTDESGRALASGVYILRLQTEDQQAIRTAVITR